MPFSKLLDQRTESIPSLVRVELLELRDDLVDPVKQLDVVEVPQGL